MPSWLHDFLGSLSQPQVELALLAAASALIALLLLLLLTSSSKKRALRRLDALNTTLGELQDRYEPNLKAEKMLADTKEWVRRESEHLDELRERYVKGRGLFKTLEEQTEIYKDSLDLIESGFHEPTFEFTDTEEYTAEIKAVRTEQKECVRSKEAVHCPHTDIFTLDGSKTLGKQMMNRAIRLTLRAFNHECDSIIQKVRWSNFDRSIARIKTSADQLDKMNRSLDLALEEEYVDLKVRELTLVHERALRKKEQKERAQEALKAEREAVRVERELQEALDEEEKMQELLRKARHDAEKATNKKSVQLQNRVAELENQLEEVARRAERAKSMAEQTRAGHVYVISNIGSFGEGVFKIGMTRRLDPDLRVKELGDASVPFIFDVHAMVFCDDAPSLEKELHRRFSSERVNLVNSRKEFFRVSLHDIRDAVIALDPSADFFLNAEAEQYRESEALRNSLSTTRSEDAAAAHEIPEDF